MHARPPDTKAKTLRGPHNGGVIFQAVILPSGNYHSYPTEPLSQSFTFITASREMAVMMSVLSLLFTVMFISTA